jgi:hypothetical protein
VDSGAERWIQVQSGGFRHRAVDSGAERWIQAQSGGFRGGAVDSYLDDKHGVKIEVILSEHKPGQDLHGPLLHQDHLAAPPVERQVPHQLHARLHSFNIQGTFREHSRNMQGTFREHSGNIQGTFRKHSGNIQETFREHSVRVEVDAREPSSQMHSRNMKGT